ncbi:MAG: F0F1 ATP synthase subunit A [Salinisphaera sp.]|jgi:F-type H+-transporting ATPase subunit a|nr:F0F1 ATP synthase subunit A [Salinisphaera sp.]
MATEGSSAGYITHHLTSWCVGCSAETHQPNGLVDFGAFTIDLLFMGLLCAAAICVLGLLVRRNLSVDNPGRLQLAFEGGVEYIGDQVGQVFHGQNHFVGAMALAIFMWVATMNLIDVLPIDLIPGIAQVVGHTFGAHEVFFRAVPTAALDTPFAMALVVFVIMVYYQIRANGMSGYVKRFLTHPYGKYGAPANILTTLIDDISKPISLALRLFGNMFAGELIFALLAMLSVSAFSSLSSGIFIWPVLHFITGFVWSLFDTFIALLQAFIFAVLTIVYLGMAQQTEDH